MATSPEHKPLKPERTRISSTFVAVTIAVVFLVLLIIFIAQNDRQVPIHFLWFNGSVSEAVALLAAAVAGAVLVLAAGLARILQLRMAGRRHNRAAKKAAAEPATSSTPTAAAPVTPAPATPGAGETPTAGQTPTAPPSAPPAP